MHDPATLARSESAAGGAAGRRLAAAWPYALLVAIGLFILLPKLGEFGFWDPWEPKYGETVREMIDRGSWWVPYYREEVRLAKPILVYWGILAGSSVFGLNEFGARIAGVGFAVLSLLGVYHGVSLLRGRRAGLLSALVLATVPHFYLVARQAMPDVYLFTSLGLCLLYFCVGLHGPDRRRNLHFGISYVGFALAVLAKGPIVAGVVACGTLGLYALSRVDWSVLWQPRRRLKLAGPVLAGLLGLVLATAGLLLIFVPPAAWEPGSLPALTLGRIAAGVGTRAAAAACSILAAAALVLSVVGAWRFVRHPDLWRHLAPWVRPVTRQVLLFALLFAVVAGPWHVAIVIEQGSDFFTYFILRHNVGRAGDVINQSGVSDFYLRALAIGLFPWSCWIPVALALPLALPGRDPWRERGLEIFLALAAAVTLAAFSLSATKFAHYVVPAVIPLAVLIGLAIDRTLQAPRTMAARLAWLAAFLLFLLPLTELMRDDGAGQLLGTVTVKRYVPDEMAFGSGYLLLLAGIALAMLLSTLVRSRIVVGAMVVCAALMANHASASFIPQVSVHKTMKNLCQSWKAQARDGEPIGFHGDLKHGIYFYTENRVRILRRPPDFQRFMDPGRTAFCIVEKNKLRKLEREFRELYPGARLHVVDDSHFDYHLVRNTDPDTGPAL